MTKTPLNGPKRHHFIPQFILRNFTDPNGDLWFWRRDFVPGSVANTSPTNLFVQKHLFSINTKDGQRDDRLERIFSRQESLAKDFITQLIDATRHRKRITLNEAAWSLWANFSYYLMKRSPIQMERTAERLQISKDIDKAIENGRLEGEEASLSTAEIVHNTLVFTYAMRPAPELLALMMSRGLAIYHVTNSKKSLIIGDVPRAVATIKSTMASEPERALFFPLSHDVAVGPLEKGRHVEIFNLTNEDVRNMNLATASISTAFAGRSKELVSSISQHFNSMEAALENKT